MDNCFLPPWIRVNPIKMNIRDVHVTYLFLPASCRGLPGQTPTRGGVQPSLVQGRGRGERYHAPFRKSRRGIIILYAARGILLFFPAWQPWVEPFSVRSINT